MRGGQVKVEKLMGDVRMQVITCPCGCWRNYLIATIEGEHDRWVTMDVFDDAAIIRTVSEAVSLLSNPENLYALAHVLAMVGCEREVLMRPGTALLQYKVQEEAPDWLFNVPVEFVEEIRGLVFGHDITKTIWAVECIGAVTSAQDCRRPPVRNVEQLRDALAPMVVLAWGSTQ